MPSEVWMKSLTNLHRWHLWMDKQSGDGVGSGVAWGWVVVGVGVGVEWVGVEWVGGGAEHGFKG